MLNDPQAFLRYFDGIHRRTVRDIQALPELQPNRGRRRRARARTRGASRQIVHHICESRMYFARAYRNEGWLYDWEVPSTASIADWVPTLETSAAEFRSRIEGTPADWLTRRIKMIDTDGMLSGWRILMMLVEHEVHHRSQIDTYAGMQGWDVPQIYGRTREQIDELQEEQQASARGD